MYQASIRDKKKHKTFNHQKKSDYEIDLEYEEYAYVKKLLGNCRLQIITNSGIEAIGIIRGKFRNYSTKIIFEVGDIIVVSKRDYQNTKVDVVHKFNSDQVQELITNEKISNILCSLYNNYSKSSLDIELNNVNFTNDIDSEDEIDNI